MPGPCLEYGARLLRNGVDRRDVATATAAALEAVAQRRVKLFRSIVHTDHGMRAEVIGNLRRLGSDWCEQHLPSSRHLLEKYAIALPQKVEQHDLSEARSVLGWTPAVSFLDFLRDLQMRDARGDDVTQLQVPGELPNS